MTSTNLSVQSLSVALILALPSIALAHPTGHDGEPVAGLHVDDSYANCFFDLHPELTQSEFDEFAKEAGAITRFHQISSAETLGRGNFNVSLAMAETPVDDAKGAWNNTMSHPEEDHYLGHEVAFPRIIVRVGVAERVDVGAWATVDPNASYGFVGLDSKISILRQDENNPVSIAIRPNASALLGPKEVWVGNAGVDVSVSRNYKGLSPYLGFSAMTSVAVERSDEVDLDPGTSNDLVAFTGLSYNWKKLSMAAEAEVGPMTTYALRIGGNF